MSDLPTAKPGCKIPRNPEGERKARELFDRIQQTPSGPIINHPPPPQPSQGEKRREAV